MLLGRPICRCYVSFRGCKSQLLKAHVDDFMLLDGHCMWGPGQLQAELDDATSAADFYDLGMGVRSFPIPSINPWDWCTFTYMNA